MTSPSTPRLATENAIQFGALKAIQSALVACVLGVFLNLCLLAVNGALRDGFPTPIDLFHELATIMLLTLALSCAAGILAILPAFIGGLALAWLIRAQLANPPYQTKTWQGWIIGGIAGLLVLLTVFLISEWVGSIGDNVVTYERGAGFLWAFYVIEFASFGGTAGVWTHRQVRRQFLEKSVDKAG